MTTPKIHLHQKDLPGNLDLGSEIAVDCEMMGLNLTRDRLCLVQLRGRDTDIHLVQIHREQDEAPNLKKILEDKNSVKIFHFARIDIAVLNAWLSIGCEPLYCTKIASKLTRTYTERHGLKDLTREVTGVDLSKQQQLSDWGQEKLSQDQIDYAASDVMHLHAVMDHTKQILTRENRLEIAQACFDFLPVRAALDLMGWEDSDIFAHS